MEHDVYGMQKETRRFIRGQRRNEAINGHKTHREKYVPQIDYLEKNYAEEQYILREPHTSEIATNEEIRDQISYFNS